MATIVIMDLPESTELDRQAMLAIAGGARFRAGAGGASAAPTAVRRIRLFGPVPGGGAVRAAPRPPPPR